MFFYGIFFILFGVLIFLKPEFLSYIIASFFVIAGINILTVYFMLKKAQKDAEDIVIGSYKIMKK